MGLRHRQPPALALAHGAAGGPALSRCALAAAAVRLPPDMARVPAEVNRLSNQVLVHTYEQEWGQVHP
jgi:hypothetical protein